MRLVRPPGAGRLSPRRASLVLAGAAAAQVLLGCSRRAPGADVSVAWTLTPDPPTLGPATLALSLSDPAARPLTGAHVRLEATMSHPGMQPVLADAVDRGAGRYEASFSFTMAGDWIVLVSGSLADGRPFSHRIDLPPVRPSPAS